MLNLGELVARMRVDKREFDKGVKDGEKSFKGLANRITNIAAVAGAAAAVAFGVALVGAMDEQDVGTKVAAKLGRSKEDAARFGHLAGQIYASNFGESVADVGDVLAQVLRANLAPEDAGDDVLKSLTEKALLLRDVFQQDVTKSVKAVQQILRNGLAPDATYAFDLIARGVQEGVDKSEDLLDTFNEYGTQFRELGLSGQEALGLMSQGLKAGARDADTVADALKEFAIRAKDGSKLSRESFAAIGLNADQMFQTFAKGGPAAKAVLTDVIARLKAMKDPVAQDTIAVGLFGTKAEDLQDALFALDPSTAVAAMGNVEGATARAAETMATSASANIESFKRQLEIAFVQTLGGVVLPMVTNVAKFLSSEFGPAFKTVAGFVKENQEWLAPLAVTLGTFAGIVAVVVGAMKIWAAVTAAYTVVQWALNGAMLANPIGLVVIAIAALVAGLIYAYKNSETFRKIVDAAFKGIATAGKWLWTNVLKPIFAIMVANFKLAGAVAMWLWRNVLVPAGQGIAAVFGVLMRIIRSVGALFGWLAAQVIKPQIAVIMAVVHALGEAWHWLYANAIGPAIDFIAARVAWARGMLSNAFGFIMGIVEKVGATWGRVFGAIAGFVSDAFSKAVDFAKRHINTLIGLVNKAIGFINNNLIGGLNKVPGVSFPRMPTLPHLAVGGTVHPRAGGRPVIMGDGGEVEYGVPHSDMERIIGSAVAAGGGEGSTITIVVTDEMKRVRKKARVQGGQPRTVLVGG